LAPDVNGPTDYRRRRGHRVISFTVPLLLAGLRVDCIDVVVFGPDVDGPPTTAGEEITSDPVSKLHFCWPVSVSIA
jgi:hypothetical protein